MKIVRRYDDQPDDGALDALVLASRAIAEHDEPTATLEGILDTAIRLVGGDEGSIQLLDPNTKSLRVVASRGLDETAQRQRIALGQGISGRVAATGEPVLLRSAVDIERFKGHILKHRSIHGAMSVPLVAREETLGVLNVTLSYSGRTFSDRELRLLEAFASVAAHAVLTSRMLAERRRHSLELDILRGSIARLDTATSLASVAEAALQDALSLAGASGAFVCVTTSQDRPPTIVRFAGMTREAMRRILGSPGFRRFRIPPEPRVVIDVVSDPVFAPLARDLKGRPLALIPMRAGSGHAMGLLGVALPARAGEDTKRILWTYGTQVGLALWNVALHQAVSEGRDELDTIVRTLDLPTLVIGADGCFRAINMAAATTLRLSPEFEVGQPAAGKLDPAIEELALDRDDDVTAEVAIMAGAHLRTYRVLAGTVPDGSGRGARILILNDVTVRDELERRKADFLAVIGHELRTPLTTIKGFATTVARRGAGMSDDARAGAIATILAQSERLERLIQDLLFVSRVEDREPPLHLGWDDVRQICVDMIAEVSRREPERVIRFDHPGDDVPIYTDRVKVEQILLHLLDNAIKFSPAPSMIRVVLSEQQRTVSIAISDEGKGVYTGDIERIFDPFIQVDGSATREAGGTGVGLYVSSMLARVVGARLEVDSALGKGSTFTLIVPRKAIEPQASS